MQTWMIYGANGYTGRLMAEEAKRRGLAPVLAGRSQAVADLAAELGLPARVFPLEEAGAIARHLEGITVVLHCAGPFSQTSKPMLDACLQAGCHYLDITGELQVFEALYARHAELAERGIVGISGVGFDVVPTDCLAAMLKQQLPDATTLRLALSGTEAISPGTAKTIIEGLTDGAMIRQDGRLVTVPLAHKTAMIPFEASASLAMTVPLADLVSAERSTGIPNIETYLKADPGTLLGTHLIRLASPVIAATRGMLQQAIGRVVKGPSEQKRRAGHTVVWGEVENAAGRKVSMRLRTQEAYTFTVVAAIASVLRVLEGQIPPGAWTPSQAFGAEFVTGLPGVQVEALT